MGEPTAGGLTPPPLARNVARQLDECRRELTKARADRTAKRESWKLAEARLRMKLRAIDSSAGERWASEDVSAAIVVDRNDPKTESGKSWIAYQEARAVVAKLESDVEAFIQANWDAVQAGRFGI